MCAHTTCKQKIVLKRAHEKPLSGYKKKQAESTSLTVFKRCQLERAAPEIDNSIESHTEPELPNFVGGCRIPWPKVNMKDEIERCSCLAIKLQCDKMQVLDLSAPSFLV